MNSKMNLNAGGRRTIHNQTVVNGLKVRTKINAGILPVLIGNHNQTFISGMKVKTNVKAGPTAVE